MEMSVTHFKARCVGVIEKVQRERAEVVITRYGRPAARLVPVEEGEAPPLFGRARGTVRMRGDILTTGETWDADA